uniref:28S ribosomal protein S18a, mitochondrial n=1 Tax=Parastrongyloides trichosuri TaxID=131310 RepID=A0A0N4ZI76_PARTI
MLTLVGGNLSRCLINNNIKKLSTTSYNLLRKVQERIDGDTTVVEMVNVEQHDKRPKIPLNNDVCSLCTCNVPVKISYKDVLILEQFMREDGTVLPRQMTGLCKRQQLRVERCVMEAHWSGLFPDKTIPEFDRAGYKRFNRYWDDDMDMYKLSEKKEKGTWYYIKRYNSKASC